MSLVAILLLLFFLGIHAASGQSMAGESRSAWTASIRDWFSEAVGSADLVANFLCRNRTRFILKGRRLSFGGPSLVPVFWY